MELAFSTNQIRFLQKVYHDIRHQEETAEAIVPDSYPDVLTIADSFASVYLRSKECRNGSAVVSGAVKAGVIFIPEDGGSQKLLEYYIPVAIKFDSVDIMENAQIQAQLRVCSVDARIVNSRKVVVRVNLGCEVLVFKDTVLEVHTLTDRDPRLQCRDNHFKACVPVEVGEKHISVNDMIEMREGDSPVVRICKSCCSIELTDRKLIGDKAVFKGNLHIKVVFQSDDDRLLLLHHVLPLSQYCELNREYDEEMLEMNCVLTNFDAAAEGAGTNNIRISADLMVQCTVLSDIELDLVEDAYSVGGTLNPAWSEYVLENRLDYRIDHETAGFSLEGKLDRVLDCDVYADFPVWSRNDDMVKAVIPVWIKASGYQEDGVFSGISGKTEFSEEYALCENAWHRMDVITGSDLAVRAAGNGIEVRFGCELRTEFWAPSTVRNLCGGEILPTDQTVRRPAVIAKKVSADMPLWDIGKAYGTSVASLQQANRLSTDHTAGGMLLIPSE